MMPETEYWGAAETEQSQLDGLSQRKAHNKDPCMQTGRYMCRQKYTWSKSISNITVVYTYNVDLNNFLP